MDILDIIKNRRSIRKYQKKEVPKEVIKDILTAAFYAPSAGNARTFEFVVIDDKEILGKIPKIHPYAAMCAFADKAIVVCGNLDKEKYDGFWSQDCSAATENLLLMAHALGVGSVWCGIYPEKDRVESFKKLLNLPKAVIPFAICPLGYPDESHQSKERYNEDAVFYNSYSKD
ncbi:MAG: FMN reductase (NAD(P)H) [Alphaproteobacteria bacterium ADurb.Bin438]|nr:MAG: FMN reductase (NAD(P)H) [Alphaproteobacteria bacterium ADurb.Bin438]